MNYFRDPSKALLPPDLTTKAGQAKAVKRPWLKAYSELRVAVNSYEERVARLEAFMMEASERIASLEAAVSGTGVREGAEAGAGVHTRAGVSAGSDTHSAVSMGLGEGDSGVKLLDRLVVLESAGVLRRCLGCGKVIAGIVERDGVGSRKRGWRRFCDVGCRLDWEGRTGKRYGGLRQTGIQSRYRGVYRDGVVVLYRWLVGRGYVGTRVVRGSGVLGSWYWEVGGDRRFLRLVGIMVGLGLLESRLVPVNGLSRREWCVVEPVVSELLGGGDVLSG